MKSDWYYRFTKCHLQFFRLEATWRIAPMTTKGKQTTPQILPRWLCLHGLQMRKLSLFKQVRGSRPKPSGSPGRMSSRHFLHSPACPLWKRSGSDVCIAANMVLKSIRDVHAEGRFGRPICIVRGQSSTILRRNKGPWES